MFAVLADTFGRAFNDCTYSRAQRSQKWSLIRCTSCHRDRRLVGSLLRLRPEFVAVKPEPLDADEREDELILGDDPTAEELLETLDCLTERVKRN